MEERITFFDPVHGIGMNVAAGSGRSWIEEPDGDPRHAHCRIDVPGDALLPSPGPGPRPTSNTVFVAWDDLLRFADQLAGLAVPDRTGAAWLDNRFALLRIRVRRDGRLRAETAFSTRQHVAMTVRCQTLWDWHFGVRDDLPVLADRIRIAVSRTRPGTGSS